MTEICGEMCKVCHLPPTHEGHDPCISNLPGIAYACCGHGNHPHGGYIMLRYGGTIRFPSDVGGARIREVLSNLLDGNVRLPDGFAWSDWPKRPVPNLIRAGQGGYRPRPEEWTYEAYPGLQLSDNYKPPGKYEDQDSEL